MWARIEGLQADLEKAVREGDSFTTIADVLNRKYEPLLDRPLTRNAVLGRAHRLGIGRFQEKQKRPRIKPAVKQVKPAAAQHSKTSARTGLLVAEPAFAAQRAAVGKALIEQQAEVDVGMEPTMRFFDTRAYIDCKRIVGDINHEDPFETMACGRPVTIENSAWCSACRPLLYVARVPSRLRIAA